MLRAIAIILGLALLGLGGGLALQTGTAVAALPPGVMGALILLGMLFERYRYPRLGDAPPGVGWTDSERFRDRYVRLRP
jgi:hypothetical protein